MSSWPDKFVRRAAAEWREYRRWVPLQEIGDVRAYYGFDHLPGRSECVSGGIVKCLDLAERFPNSPNKANLLYLISSALPERRELLARAAQRAGGKVVLNQNGVAYPAWARGGWQKQNAPNARVHAMADYVVYQSHFCRRCAERFLGPRKGPGEVLYNPVDTEVFSPRHGFDLPVSNPVLLVAGSHHDGYRIQLAVDALAKIRTLGICARLIVAGRLVWDAEAEAEARTWACNAGVEDAVEFVGPYSQEAAPDLFRRAHILVHLKVQDPCPRLVVEAMACGLPVVYSATGGVPELVGEESGVGISCQENFEHMQPPSSDEVVDAIERAIANREEMARQGRSRAVRLFSTQQWVAAHARIFESLTYEANL